MTTRTKEPQTRAGILAAGLVQIVKTPEQLTEEGLWWVGRNGDRSHFSASGRQDPDHKRANTEALSASLPRWLRPPLTPAEAVRRMFKDADAEYRDAARYVGGKRYKTPSEMTELQRKAALGAIARRLRGEDASFGFEMA